MNPAQPIDRHGQPIVHGDIDGVIQSGWNITEDQYGLLTGTVSIRYDSQNISSSAIPSVGSVHPYNSELRSYKGSVNHGGGNNAMMSIEYIGIGNGRSETIGEVEVSGSSSSQQMPLHPKFSNLFLEIPPDKDGKNWKPKAYVDTKNNDGITFEAFNAITAPDGLRGVDSYYAQRTTVRVSFYTYNTSIVKKHLNGIGCYADKPYNAGNFVGIPTGGNYLLTSCSASKYGTTYKISAEWTSSEQGTKWSALLYRAWGVEENQEVKDLLTLKGATSNSYSIGANASL
jgi:hypothetical protein